MTHVKVASQLIITTVNMSVILCHCHIKCSDNESLPYAVWLIPVHDLRLAPIGQFGIKISTSVFTTIVIFIHYFISLQKSIGLKRECTSFIQNLSHSEETCRFGSIWSYFEPLVRILRAMPYKPL